MVVVVYTNEIVLWDAETGEVSKRIEDIVQEVGTTHTHCVLRATPDTPVPAPIQRRQLLHAPFLTLTHLRGPPSLRPSPSSVTSVLRARTRSPRRAWTTANARR